MKLRHESVLGQMSAEQLKFVLKRFAPGSKATRKAEVTREIIAVLGSPERIDAALARLEPHEARIMQELKRRGGVANGLVLAANASVLGLPPSARTTVRRTGGWYYRTVGVTAYLQDMLDGGFLLPASPGAEWFEFGRSYETQNLVTADCRVLARVQYEPARPPAPISVPEATPSAALLAPHPAAIVLQLHGVLQLVGREGGVQVTKKNEVAKAFLKRLERASPELASELWWTLPVLMQLELVTPPVAGSNVWRVDNGATNALRGNPLVVQYARIVDAYMLVQDTAFERAWRDDWRQQIRDCRAVWRAALDALVLLPQHPVTVEAAANGLWAKALDRVFGRTDRPTRPSSTQNTNEVPAALISLLAGQFTRLGLLRSDGADEAASAVVQKGDGSSWYERAVYGSLARTARDDSVAAADEQRAALLVQPNFEVLAYLDRLDDAAMRALSCATVTRLDAHTATFTIDRRSFEVALETGGTTESVLASLDASSPGVPNNVRDSLTDWAARRERLTLTPSVDLVEYHSSAARDLGLRVTPGARPVGERFLVLPATPSAPPPGLVERDYDEPPPTTVRFRNDGSLSVSGQLDLAVRWALANAATDTGKGTFRLDPEAVRTGTLTAASLNVLNSATKGGIPARIEALLRAWGSGTPPPAVAKASVFRHPDAALLAEFKGVGSALSAKLSPSTYLIEPGKEAALQKALKALGIDTTNTLAPDSGALKADGEGELQRGLSTRKTRELLEAAIEAGHNVQLEYANEVESWTRYGSYRRSRGKVRDELVRPESVTYAGSTPYLVCYTVSRGTERLVRIGYIDGLAVRSAG